MAGRIVVVHQGALGDFLLSLAALQGIARACPSLSFFFRTRPEHFELIAREPQTAGFKSGDAADLALFYLSRGWEQAALPHGFDGAEGALVFGQTSSIPLAENLAKRLPFTVHWVQSFPPEGVDEHVTRFIAAQLRALGWRLEDVVLRLSPTPPAVGAVASLLAQTGIHDGQPIVVTHMGSGGKRKIWPIPGWRTLLGRLARERGERLVTVLGPADDPLREIVHDMARELDLTVMEGLSLSQLAALLSRASAYVGNDSGVTHLAAAMGVPTVALFGPTRPQVWAPLGDHVRVIQSDWPTGEDPDAARGGDVAVDVERIRLQLLAALG